MSGSILGGSVEGMVFSEIWEAVSVDSSGGGVRVVVVAGESGVLNWGRAGGFSVMVDLFGCLMVVGFGVYCLERLGGC